MDRKTTDSVRLFYALWPDDATRAALLRLQTTMQGRKTRQENLHITLAFLDQQPANLIPELAAILARIPKPDMTLAIDRVGYFTRHRIAWAGMHQVPDALSLLQRELARTLAQHNIAFDNQAGFKPHITLARDAPAPPDFPFEPIHWQANQVALVQSVIQPGGVSYRVLACRWLDTGF